MNVVTNQLFICLRKNTIPQSTVFLNFRKKDFVDQKLSFIHSSSLENKNSSSLIYEGPLRRRIKGVKLLSLSSSMLGFAMLPVVVKDLCHVNILLGVGGGLISTAFLSTPFLLHWITKRYITELHFDPHTKLFTAKTVNIISQETEFQFSAEEVSVPDVPGMLSSFVVRNQPLFVDDRIVTDYDAYAHMMGYDKPLDFKLGESKEKPKNPDI